MDDALKVFTNKYPEANIEDISFDKDRQTSKYEIEAFDESNEYNIEISAKDGSIIKDNSEKDHTANKKAIDNGLVSKVDGLIVDTLKDAGSDYYLDSYSIEYDETKAYTQLEIEVKNSSGKDIEYKYNLETGELIKKDR
ncbi:PepSY domain-containing protein [Finegoldia magna]|uniref:PepSY domain-containing protein n=1 Tax=Finegoldia magna TaxID=1260 RepID=UPI00290BB8FF|nr:PepSY domain-containing protein [Finegoldia magna]MDU5201184.1 PepSY domain-containing protein [Finegoldia magna]MDU6776241.1 PepSY domain-containing protein [Finegoldia magna]